MGRYRFVPDERLPPFSGGAVGYLSYDTVRHFERLPENLEDDLGLPDMYFMLTDTLLAFDRQTSHTGVEGLDRRLRQGQNFKGTRMENYG